MRTYRKHENSEDWGRTTKRDRIHDVKQMHEIHHQIKRRLFMGQSGVHICRALGVGRSLVSHVKNSLPVRKELSLMNDAADSRVIDLRNEIEAIAPIAVENLKEVVEQGTLNGEQVGLKIIVDESNKIIDRHLGKPAQTTLGKVMHTHFTADDIEKLKAEAKARGIQSGQVIDITPEEDTDAGKEMTQR
jgi:DNA polymerase III delta prime subunit